MQAYVLFHIEISSFLYKICAMYTHTKERYISLYAFFCNTVRFNNFWYGYLWMPNQESVY